MRHGPLMGDYKFPTITLTMRRKSSEVGNYYTNTLDDAFTGHMSDLNEDVAPTSLTQKEMRQIESSSKATLVDKLGRYTTTCYSQKRHWKRWQKEKETMWTLKTNNENIEKQTRRRSSSIVNGATDDSGDGTSGDGGATGPDKGKIIWPRLKAVYKVAWPCNWCDVRCNSKPKIWNNRAYIGDLLIFRFFMLNYVIFNF